MGAREQGQATKWETKGGQTKNLKRKKKRERSEGRGKKGRLEIDER